MTPLPTTALRSRQTAWLRDRTTTSRTDDVALAARLLADGNAGCTTASVVIPARDEEATVGPLVAGLVAGLLDAPTPLPVEVVVVDDGSQDATAQRAADAGARVVRGGAPGGGPAGKGEAMRRGLAATTGDLVVFLDADVPDFRPHWVASLLLPLLRDDRVVLVKAAYDRPLTVDGVTHPGSGGRVTRLVAVPVLNLVAPELTVIAQPLAGETAARRTFLERGALGAGYSVELGLLLDAYAANGLDGLAQVDLGERAHRHQSDEALGRMATQILRMAAGRAGWPVEPVLDAEGYAHVRRGADGAWELSVLP